MAKEPELLICAVCSAKKFDAEKNICNACGFSYDVCDKCETRQTAPYQPFCPVCGDPFGEPADKKAARQKREKLEQEFKEKLEAI